MVNLRVSNTRSCNYRSVFSILVPGKAFAVRYFAQCSFAVTGRRTTADFSRVTETFRRTSRCYSRSSGSCFLFQTANLFIRGRAQPFIRARTITRFVQGLVRSTPRDVPHAFSWLRRNDERRGKGNANHGERIFNARNFLERTPPRNDARRPAFVRVSRKLFSNRSKFEHRFIFLRKFRSRQLIVRHV